MLVDHIQTMFRQYPVPTGIQVIRNKETTLHGQSDLASGRALHREQYHLSQVSQLVNWQTKFAVAKLPHIFLPTDHLGPSLCLQYWLLSVQHIYYSTIPVAIQDAFSLEIQQNGKFSKIPRKKNSSKIFHGIVKNSLEKYYHSNPLWKTLEFHGKNIKSMLSSIGFSTENV